MDTPSYRTHVSLENQAAARRSRMDLGTPPATTSTLLAESAARTASGRAGEKSSGEGVGRRQLKRKAGGVAAARGHRTRLIRDVAGGKSQPLTTRGEATGGIVAEEQTRGLTQ